MLHLANKNKLKNPKLKFHNVTHKQLTKLASLIQHWFNVRVSILSTDRFERFSPKFGVFGAYVLWLDALSNANHANPTYS